MTQKEIMDAKKKAKECLEVFNRKVPMTKMKIYFFVYSEYNFHINFIDVHTGDFFTCILSNNVYKLHIKYKDTGKIHVFHASKGGR